MTNINALFSKERQKHGLIQNFCKNLITNQLKSDFV